MRKDIKRVISIVDLVLVRITRSKSQRSIKNILIVHLDDMFISIIFHLA